MSSPWQLNHTDLFDLFESHNITKKLLIYNGYRENIFENTKSSLETSQYINMELEKYEKNVEYGECFALFVKPNEIVAFSNKGFFVVFDDEDCSLSYLKHTELQKYSTAKVLFDECILPNFEFEL